MARVGPRTFIFHPRTAGREPPRIARPAVRTPASRVLSVIFLAAMSASAAASLLAGVVATTLGGAAAILACAAAVSVGALTATFARGIRGMRPVDDVTPA